MLDDEARCTGESGEDGRVRDRGLETGDITSLPRAVI
jgi:hypothetical protein